MRRDKLNDRYGHLAVDTPKAPLPCRKRKRCIYVQTYILSFHVCINCDYPIAGFLNYVRLWILASTVVLKNVRLAILGRTLSWIKQVSWAMQLVCWHSSEARPKSWKNQMRIFERQSRTLRYLCSRITLHLIVGLRNAWHHPHTCLWLLNFFSAMKIHESFLPSVLTSQYRN